MAKQQRGGKVVNLDGRNTGKDRYYDNKGNKPKDRLRPPKKKEDK